MSNLEIIRQAGKELTAQFQDKLRVNSDLNRTLVSFQANKKQNGYRWFKYKEGFSASLVNYILDTSGIATGRLLDPFAGSGAALFAASARGMDAVGIELLPVGCEIIRARQLAQSSARDSIVDAFDYWLKQKPWTHRSAPRTPFQHLRITAGAFPPETESLLASYVGVCEVWPDEAAKTVLRFAAMCILEEISYTRKDGQYLRWDYRSGRRQGTKIFDKGTIIPFTKAIEQKLLQIRNDLCNEPQDLFAEPSVNGGTVDIVCSSCLDRLPLIELASFDCVVTSPPYCNRYDYTRTYALELAFLGADEDKLKELRQAMVSCTVENREKEDLHGKFGKSATQRARQVYGGQELLNHVFAYLEAQKAAKLLNNHGIPRMVRNYFWEMTLVIAECARILKPGAPFVMVNDNVRYAGASIPVDLVLSAIATASGFAIEEIWSLPVGKGNSSQQMGKHGRDELRKGVYIWRAPAKRARRPSPPLVAASLS